MYAGEQVREDSSEMDNTDKQKGRNSGPFLNSAVVRLAGFGDAKQPAHLFVQKTMAGHVRLNPFSVDDELGNSAFSGLTNYFFSGAGGSFDIHFFIRDAVLIEEALCVTAIVAPRRGVDEKFHSMRAPF
jgi:hypothetical protein